MDFDSQIGSSIGQIVSTFALTPDFSGGNLFLSGVPFDLGYPHRVCPLGSNGFEKMLPKVTVTCRLPLCLSAIASLDGPNDADCVGSKSFAVSSKADRPLAGDRNDACRQLGPRGASAKSPDAGEEPDALCIAITMGKLFFCCGKGHVH